MRFDPIFPITIGLIICSIGIVISLKDEKLRGINPSKNRKLYSRTTIFILLFLIIINPSINVSTATSGYANIDVLYVVDETASMGSLDYNGSDLRINGVKRDMLDIEHKLPGAHMSIVTFSSQVRQIMSYSDDAESFFQVVSTIEPEVYAYSTGTNIDEPLINIKSIVSTRHKEYPQRRQILLFFSDGEDNINQKIQSYSDIKKYINGGVVLGYGTQKGSKIIKYLGIKSNPADSNTQYIQMVDPATNKVVNAISHSNQDNLKNIAEQSSTIYINRNTGGGVDKLLKDTQLNKQIVDSSTVKHYVGLYWLFAIPFTILIFWEWVLFLNAELQLRKLLRKKHE